MYAIRSYYVADLLGAQGAGHRFAFQYGMDGAIADGKLYIQVGSQGHQRFFVAEFDVMMGGRQGEHAVNGAGIQQMPAQLLGQQLAYGALTGTAGSIDGNDRSLYRH